GRLPFRPVPLVETGIPVAWVLWEVHEEHVDSSPGGLCGDVLEDAEILPVQRIVHGPLEVEIDGGRIGAPAEIPTREIAEGIYPFHPGIGSLRHRRFETQRQSSLPIPF